MCSRSNKFILIAIIAVIIALSVIIGSNCVFAEEASALSSIDVYDQFTKTLNLNGANKDSTILAYESYINDRFKINNKQNLDAEIYDEWIFQIIPEELFIQKKQKFLYIGEAYGFYYNYDNATNKHFVYLIQHIFCDNITSKLKRKIKPVYYEQYTYDEQTRKASINYVTEKIVGGGYDITYNYYQKYSDVKNVYLKDVCFTGSLYNENHINQGENDYDKTKDNGAFFVGNTYAFNGVSLQSGKTDFAVELLKTGFGFVDNAYLNLLGKAISIADFALNFDGFLNCCKNDFRDTLTNDMDYGTQIYDIVPDLNASLMKTSGAMIQTDNSSNAILIGIHKDNYASNAFYYNYRNQYDKWNSRFVSNITLDIVEEEIGITGSKVKNIATDISCVNDYVYTLSNGEKTQMNTNQKSDLYVLNDAAHKVAFHAIKEGTYTIKIISNSPVDIICEKGDKQIATDGNVVLKVDLLNNEDFEFSVVKQTFAGSLIVGAIIEFTPEDLSVGDKKEFSIKSNGWKYFTFIADDVVAFDFNTTGGGKLSVTVFDAYYGHSIVNWPDSTEPSGSIILEKGIYHICFQSLENKEQVVSVALSSVESTEENTIKEASIKHQKMYLFIPRYSTFYYPNVDAGQDLFVDVYEGGNRIVSNTHINNVSKVFCKANSKYYFSIINYSDTNADVAFSLQKDISKLVFGHNSLYREGENLLLLYSNTISLNARVKSNCEFNIYDENSEKVPLEANTITLSKNKNYYFVVSNATSNQYIDFELLTSNNLQGTFPSGGIVYYEFIPNATGYYDVEGTEQYTWYNENLIAFSDKLCQNSKYYLAFEGVPSDSYDISIVLRQEAERKKIPLNVGIQLSNGKYYFEITSNGNYTFRSFCTMDVSSNITIYDEQNNVYCKNKSVDNELLQLNLKAGVYYLDLQVMPTEQTIDFRITKKR